MTELDLQEKLLKILEHDIFPEMAIFKPGEMKFLLQDIPAAQEFEYDDDTDDNTTDKWFPCCIVQLESGDNPTAAAPQDTRINIIVCVKDFSEDMSGYKSTMISLDRIRDYLLKNYGIHGKYRVEFPIKLEINTELAAPYFMARLVTNWKTETMSYRDYENFI